MVIRRAKSSVLRAWRRTRSYGQLPASNAWGDVQVGDFLYDAENRPEMCISAAPAATGNLKKITYPECNSRTCGRRIIDSRSQQPVSNLPEQETKSKDILSVIESSQ
ncbi:hypothetical protein V1522DRAFT_423382 [Lipomyces starkeyi]